MTTLSPLQQLLVDGTPLIDVRAPVEFSAGAFPTAVNLPILTDDERRDVGICYKEQGPDAARALGHNLVTGETREQRLSAWQAFVTSHPDAHLYCFRGGDRSRIACEWLAAAGSPVPRVEGGYKALRRALLEAFDDLPSLLVVSGRTGSGKTIFLKKCSHVIDLEGIANHRGSAFGGFLTPQPSQVDFENQVAIRFLSHRQQVGSDHPLMVEDEGRLIGRIHVPLPVQDALKDSPLLIIEDSLDTRAERIRQEYINEQSAQYLATFGDDGMDRFEAYLTGAVKGIRKRLGGKAHAEVLEQIHTAMAEQRSTGDTAAHLIWIKRLLSDYYDPMYDYQLKARSDRVLARGTHEELWQWYQHHLESVP